MILATTIACAVIGWILGRLQRRLQRAEARLKDIREARAHGDRMIIIYRGEVRALASLNAHAASLIAAAELEPAVILFASLRVTTPQDDYS